MSEKFSIANSYESEIDGKRYTAQQRKLKQRCAHWKDGMWQCDDVLYGDKFCRAHTKGFAAQSFVRNKKNVDTTDFPSFADPNDFARQTFCHKKNMTFNPNFSAARKKAIDVMMAEEKGD